MKEILEVPLIVPASEEAKTLFDGTPAQNKKFDQTLRYYKFSLSESKQVNFYLWEKDGRFEDESVLDRVVPRAAFSMLLLNDIYPNLQFVIQRYKIRFRTPLLIISSLSESAYAGLATKLKILNDEKGHVIFYNSSDPDRVYHILRQAIRFVLERKSPNKIK